VDALGVNMGEGRARERLRCRVMERTPPLPRALPLEDLVGRPLWVRGVVMDGSISLGVGLGLEWGVLFVGGGAFVVGNLGDKRWCMDTV